MTTKRIAVASLVEDFSLYPRNRVDETHVNDLVRALRADQVLPPLVAEKKSLRIVDGFHRRRALLRHFGEEAEAEVELKTYKTEADLFIEAVELNSHHGRKLDRHDQSRIVLKLRELKVEDRIIAVTLHVSETEIHQLSVRVVYDTTGQAIPAKRGMKHMYGQQVTSEQVAAMGSVRSAEAGRLCIELTRLLDVGLVDLTDEHIVARLKSLQSSIDSVLRAIAA